ncbi:MAG: oligopeptide transporter, OPT family [Acidobacteria bacterium]|nr:oligopeptide transporter, OPT family [Acidobacteriota bacterium]
MAKNPFLENFRPYIPDAVKNMRELTPFPIIVGTLLGIIFGASSLYLVLKTGLTVSASIPVAVISITLFRLLSKFGMKDATILENNVVQTAGSAGESIAFGVGVTMPAILILGFDLEITRVMLVAVMGGLLGILMMIPLRRALIKEQHGILKYPEGTACAEVLKAGASAESRSVANEYADVKVSEHDDSALQGGKIITIGFVMGFIYKSVMDVFSFWKGEPEHELSDKTLKGGSIALENNPALLGVGYIIGPYISSIMMAGGVLSYLVLIPMIKFFGEGLAAPLSPELAKNIGEMSPGQIRGAYILYIGAGAVATAGIISLFRSLPTIWSGLKSGLADLRGGGTNADGEALPRTDQDLSMKYVIVGVIVLMAAIMLAPQLGLSVFSNPIVSFLGALLIIILGFLFVTVSSRLTGEVGSSSNPISGMTVATLLITCLVFFLLGWTAPNPYFVTALSIGGIVCIAASNGGTTSQDLKTGFLVGGTPKKQQIAILVGALASALVLGPILLLLNDNGTVYATPVTFSKVEKEVKVDAAPLPVYTGEDKPPIGGEFRLLENKVPAGQKKPENKDLAPGKYLVEPNGTVKLKIEENFPKGARVPPGTEVGPAEKLTGTQAENDSNTYRGWHKTDNSNGIPAGKYLVDTSGEIKYLVDPGINGKLTARPDLSDAPKYDAPKATLMSYIIKGILSQELPWGLVLIGAMIAIVLELTGAPALAFAVGLYLPIATSSPIFVGGIARWAVDLYLKRKFAAQDMTESEIIAETDKSNGVLLASGYIAGAAIAGILIAIFAVVPFLKNVQDKSKAWADESNPFFSGHSADLLAMLPFLAIAVILYLVGREVLMTGRKSG